MKNRFLTTDIARLFGIAGFYEALTPHVVGGARSGKKFGMDVEHPDWNASVEVKSCGSSATPKIYSEQLEKHLEARGFPYDNCCYAVWSYYSPRQHRITSAEIRTNKQLWTELASRTRAFYILDIRVLQAVEIKLGTQYDRRYGTEASRLQINTTWLRRFAAAPGATLRKLGLRPHSFFVQQATVQTVFEGLPVSFDYTAVLPKSAAGFVWPVHRRQKPHLAAVAASA